MHLYGKFDNLQPYDREQKHITTVIDTPLGSCCKYKYDQEHGLFRLGKWLPLGAHFPYNFGFIPNTYGEDGDALDVLALMPAPVFVGCVLSVSLIGVLEAEQRERDGRILRNDRLLGTVETAVNSPFPRTLDDMAPFALDEIQHFFVAHNEMEGRTFYPLGYQGAARAWELVIIGAKSTSDQKNEA